ATSAAHYGVDNLTVIVDFNNIQIDGVMRDVMDVRDLREKYEAFGWHAVDVDGHDVDAVDQALCDAKEVKDRPSAIIAHTTIGRGVSYMEGQAKWHGVAPNDKELELAMSELVAPA
ncbi:MAG: transketolase, partial [Chlamydiales bacterium]